MDDILLEDEFQIHLKCNSIYSVQLMRQNINFYKKDSKQSFKEFRSILLKNVIGCIVFESCDKNPIPCLKITSMVKNKKRVRIKQSVAFCVGDNDKGDKKIFDVWMRTILWLLEDPSIDSEHLKAKTECPLKKKYLIVINPKSGQGKSEKIFIQQVEPILKDAHVVYETLITEYAGHCRNFASTYDYTKYDAIVICSGDGLLHEYFNGLFERCDWNEVLKVPVSILPTGSGNALAATLMYSAKEAFEISSSVFILLKGKSHPLDLFLIQTEKEKRYGFLSVTWGMASDIDIESEKYRFLGGTRFTVGFIERVCSLRQYSGKFEYLEFDENICEQGVIATESETETCDIERCVINETNDITCINKSGSYGPSSSLSSLNSQVPGNWKVIEGDFIMLNINLTSHLGLNLHSSPGSLINDGRMCAQFVMSGISKCNIVKMFLKIEDGNHLSMPELQTKNITAFRITPSPDRIGHIAVDGEEVNYGLIQGEIFPSLGNVISIHY
ncbi:sphingosine kinase 1 isoform X2 [Hydra vulgaris]|uniref:Sphingosine kinase 1 isoform X2 n=1 Tax=Hydra vulgaris TaxID=6087 RepID=A0ABM4C9P5_HYDVU